MNPTIIGIAGGTASGKTTIAKRLYDEALKNGSGILQSDFVPSYIFLQVVPVHFPDQ